MSAGGSLSRAEHAGCVRERSARKCLVAAPPVPQKACRASWRRAGEVGWPAFPVARRPFTPTSPPPPPMHSHTPPPLTDPSAASSSSPATLEI